MTSDALPPGNSANDPDWDAVARFLAGESSGDEAARVDRWLRDHPAEGALVERLSAPVGSSEMATVDVEAALREVHGRMHAPSGSTRLTIERRVTDTRRRGIMVGALLAAAAGFVAFVALRDMRSSAPASVAPARSYATKTGQRDSVTLADGSRVLLGPESRLTVPGDFGTGARIVSLEGDGYFDVRHDAARPFAVRVANGIVEDLGTTFTIESDAGSGNATMVSVLSGSVRLRPANSAPTDGALLAAGDRGALGTDGRIRAYQNAVVSDDSAWTSGRLVFRDASLDRVSGELRRWYGVGLYVADSSLRHRTVTTTIEHGQPIDQVLRILALTLGARVDRQGDSATFHAQRGF